MSDPNVTEATPEESAAIESVVGGEDLNGTWVIAGDNH